MLFFLKYLLSTLQDEENIQLVPAVPPASDDLEPMPVLMIIDMDKADLIIALPVEVGYRHLLLVL